MLEEGGGNCEGVEEEFENLKIWKLQEVEKVEEVEEA